MTTNRLPPQGDAIASAGNTRLRWFRRLVPLAFLVVAAAFLWRELGQLDLHALRRNLHALPGTTLIGLQTLALLAVLAMTLYDWRVARALRVDIRLSTLVRYSWVANTFNNLIGLSGLAGSGIRFVLLGQAGVDHRRAAAYSVVIMLSVPVGLATVCWLLLVQPATLSALPLPTHLVYTALLLFAGFLPLYLLLMRNARMHKRLLSDVPPLGWTLLVQLVAISVLDWLLAALLAWLCITAFGSSPALTDFLPAFALAAALGIFSLIPGGLGIFDAVLLLLLSAKHGNAEAILAGLLTFRAVYYLVPWFIGVYLGAGALAARDRVEQSRLMRFWRESPAAALLRLPLNALASIGIRVLAYLTFGAGVILLVSAAFPTLTDRLAVLRTYVPLAAVETSHLLSVGVAVLLIALSRGIAEQVRMAYRVTMVLLVLGALFSLIKGLDFEEAIALSLIAGALRLQRDKFYRNGYPLASPRTLWWLLGLAVALICYTVLGDWVHGTTTWHWQTMLSFSYGHEAPRFVRSLIFALAVVIVYFGWSFFRSAEPLLRRPQDAELGEAGALLAQYGGGDFGHLIFLGDKYLFWSTDRRALLQFGRIRDRLVVLGDPCGDDRVYDGIVEQFRHFADQHDMTPVFYEVSGEQMHRYHDAGFALFKLGETAYVDVEKFTLAGKRGESLRHGVNRAKRAGASVGIAQPPFSPTLWSTLRAISDAWLSELGAAEKGFSLGYYDEAYLARAPIALVRIADKIVAFANLMPDYGRRTVLSVDLMRHLPDAPAGTMDLLFIELIQHAKAEGYRYFNLGMAPLAGVGETRFARAGERVVRLAYEYGNRFYNYKGLRSFKEKFQPQWRSTYLAYPVFTPLPPLLVDTAALIAGGYRQILFKAD